MKKFIIGLLLSVLIAAPAHAGPAGFALGGMYVATQQAGFPETTTTGAIDEVLRATQSFNVDESSHYFHGQVFLQNAGRPRDLILVLETSEGQEITRSRCLLTKVAPRTFKCEEDTLTASVRRKRGSRDTLNIIVKNYSAAFNLVPDLEITTKIIVNTRVVSYTNMWHFHDTTYVDVYRKENQ